MRGNQDEQEEVFSYIPLEKRVPQDHPLRRVREMTDRALQELSSWFDSLYAQTGRPSIPPEQLLRAQILQALYTIRSERQLMDQIDGNWRYRWFVGLKLDDGVWDVTVFTKNRDRLLRGEVSQKFFERVRAQAEAPGCWMTSTLPWMAPCWRRGRAATVSNRRKIRHSGAAECEGENCCGTCMRARPIRRRGSTRRARQGRPSQVI